MSYLAECTHVGYLLLRRQEYGLVELHGQNVVGLPDRSTGIAVSHPRAEAPEPGENRVAGVGMEPHVARQGNQGAGDVEGAVMARSRATPS